MFASWAAPTDNHSNISPRLQRLLRMAVGATRENAAVDVITDLSYRPILAADVHDSIE